jgi:putative intracellular protease/amidase
VDYVVRVDDASSSSESAVSKYVRAFTRTLAALLLSAPLSAVVAADAAAKPAEIRVGIVLFDGVQIIDFAAPYEVFGQARFRVFTVSMDGKPVTAEMGLKVTPDHAMADAPAMDVLVVPGGSVHAAMRDASLLAALRARSPSARHVLSICTGAHLLAEAGLLDGLRATTFHDALDGLARDYPKIDVVRDQRYVDNGRIITSAGLASGIDASLHVVARLRGETVAKSVALHLEYDWQPTGGFVRGLLADRHKPQGADPQLPEGTRVRKVSGVGDRDRWETQYEVTTSLTTDALQARIAAAMAKMDDWKPAGGQPGAPDAWRRQTADDGAWRVRYRIAGADDGVTFMVVETVERDGATAPAR